MRERERERKILSIKLFEESNIRIVLIYHHWLTQMHVEREREVHSSSITILFCIVDLSTTSKQIKHEYVGLY